MDEVEEGAGQEFFVRVAEDAGEVRVDAQEVAVQAGDAERVEGQLEEPDHVPLGAVQVGEVHDGAGKPEGERREGDGHGDRRAVLARAAQLALRHQRRHGPLRVGLAQVYVVLDEVDRDEGLDGQAHQFARRVAEGRMGAVVGEDDGAVVGDGQHADGGRLDVMPERVFRGRQPDRPKYDVVAEEGGLVGDVPPGVVLGPEPVLEAYRPAIREEGGEEAFDLARVLGVDERMPVLATAGQLVFGVAQDRLPVTDPGDLVAGHVPAVEKGGSGERRSAVDTGGGAEEVHGTGQ